GWGSFPPPSATEPSDESAPMWNGFAPKACRSWGMPTAASSGAQPKVRRALCYDRTARVAGLFYVMPNIKQQKKRVRTATRERLENLRYRSTVKTLTKRLQTAVADGDQERASAEHRELV